MHAGLTQGLLFFTLTAKCVFRITVRFLYVIRSWWYSEVPCGGCGWEGTLPAGSIKGRGLGGTSD